MMDPAASEVTTLAAISAGKLSMNPDTRLPRMTTAVQRKVAVRRLIRLSQRYAGTVARLNAPNSKEKSMPSWLAERPNCSVSFPPITGAMSRTVYKTAL